MIDVLMRDLRQSETHPRTAESDTGLRTCGRADWFVHRGYNAEPTRANRRAGARPFNGRDGVARSASLGERSYDRVLSMSDDDGQAWLKAHEDRAEDLIWCFYAVALLSLAAIAVPTKFPRSAVPLALATLLFGIVVFGMGGYIAYAGGKIRHREFRNVPPPKEERESGSSG